MCFLTAAESSNELTVLKGLCYSITGGERVFALRMAQYSPLLAFVYSHYRAGVKDRLNLEHILSHIAAYS